MTVAILLVAVMINSTAAILYWLGRDETDPRWLNRLRRWRRALAAERSRRKT